MSWDNENYKVILGCKDVKPELYSINRVSDGRQLFDIVTGNKQMIEGKMNSLLCMNNLTKLNGKILIQCDVKVEKIYAGNIDNQFDITSEEYKNIISNDIKERLQPQFFGGLIGYAIYLKNIDILERPRDVSECDQYRRPALYLKHLPKNMCDCYNYYGWWNILITLTPQEMCNVLNGKQTIIVRKEILEDRLKRLIESRWRKDDE